MIISEEKTPAEVLSERLEALNLPQDQLEDLKKKINETVTLDVAKHELLPFDASKFFRLGFGHPGLDNFYAWENIFNDEEIRRIFESTSDIPIIQGTLGNSGVQTSVRKSEIKWIPNNAKFSWLYEKIARMIYSANKDLFNFNVTGFTEEIQLTKYEYVEGSSEPQSYYLWHSDVGASVPWRKISLTVQLSDPSEYEGCDLKFLITKDPITLSKEKGSAVAFPSYFQHCVTPVTKGTRYSLVVWATGPPFK